MRKTRGRSIAVIGAGPAGTTLATLLARAGFRVALFSRATSGQRWSWASRWFPPSSRSSGCSGWKTRSAPTASTSPARRSSSTASSRSRSRSTRSAAGYPAMPTTCPAIASTRRCGRPASAAAPGSSTPARRSSVVPGERRGAGRPARAARRPSPWPPPRSASAARRTGSSTPAAVRACSPGCSSFPATGRSAATWRCSPTARASCSITRGTCTRTGSSTAGAGGFRCPGASRSASWPIPRCSVRSARSPRSSTTPSCARIRT